jgi:hypothetical protein
MTSLKPQPPFVWPEPRALEKICTYEYQPPFGELALSSRSLFGIVSALTGRGIDVLECWLKSNPDLQVCLVVTVYPACATRGADLFRLLQTVQRLRDRLSVSICPLESITDRATNALCFLTPDCDVVHIVTGPCEDLGLDLRQKGQINFAFRADPAVTEAFKRYFDWLWVHSREITAKGVTFIPDLILPEGSEEGARQWQAYIHECTNANLEGERDLVAHVDPVTGDIKVCSEDRREVAPPTEKLGLAKLDQLADHVARLYDKGALVSIDKLSRIPPLDAPLNPSLFGDTSELQKGNVTRKVSWIIT